MTKTQKSVDKIASKKHELEMSIRKYADDRANIYRQPAKVPLDDPESGFYYAFRYSEMHFLTYVSHMIEQTSKLMPRPTSVMCNAHAVFIPLI